MDEYLKGSLKGDIVEVSRSLPPTVEKVDAETVKSLRDTLQLRPVRHDELDKLYNYRLECGWGAERLKDHWGNPDWPEFVLIGKDPSGAVVEMGMAGIILDGYGGLANRAEGIVTLSSLYVQPKFRGGGIGMRAFELMEQIAEQQYHAKALTLDTTAYKFHPSDDKTHDVEIIGQKSDNRLMYERRGYVAFTVRILSFPESGAENKEPEPSYPNGKGKDLHSINMKKIVGGQKEKVGNGHVNGKV